MQRNYFSEHLRSHDCHAMSFTIHNGTNFRARHALFCVMSVEMSLCFDVDLNHVRQKYIVTCQRGSVSSENQLSMHPQIGQPKSFESTKGSDWKRTELCTPFM